MTNCLILNISDEPMPVVPSTLSHGNVPGI